MKGLVRIGLGRWRGKSMHWTGVRVQKVRTRKRPVRILSGIVRSPRGATRTRGLRHCTAGGRGLRAFFGGIGVWGWGGCGCVRTFVRIVVRMQVVVRVWVGNVVRLFVRILSGVEV